MRQTYDDRDVGSCQEVHLGVSDRHVREKYETLGIRGENLGAIFQEGHVLSGPVFPDCMTRDIGFIVSTSFGK